MKIKIVFSLALIVTTNFIESKAIKLASPIIDMIDGAAFGIDDEVIAMIKQYQGQIMAMLVGKASQDSDKKVGSYQFENNKYTIQQLSTLEQEQGTNEQFTLIGHQIRNDFEKISNPFKMAVHGAKKTMISLIEESCEKRNRLNSLLCAWAKTDDKNVYELFDIHVKSIKDYEVFLTDLYNFLGDLVHSCPKAQALFAQRLSKFKHVKELYIELELPSAQQHAFLKYVNGMLSTIKSTDITKEKVTELYHLFLKL